MCIKQLSLETLKQWLFYLLIIVFFTSTSRIYAAQESNSISENTTVPIVKDKFEWQFMTALSLVSAPTIYTDVKQREVWNYVELGLLFDISYNGFFLQTNTRRSSAIIDGGELGYQITVQDNWQLDVIIKDYIESFDPVETIEDQKKDIPQLKGLDERDSTTGIALRYSHFFDQAIFYLDIAYAYAGKNEKGNYITGFIIDSFYSYLIPYQNWDIYLGAGLTYYNKEFIDYYIGVNPDEVTSDRLLYNADSNFRAQLEIYAQYPLSQSWSFNTGLTQTFYSNKIKQSPLVDRNKLTQFMVGVLYVF
jgi:hypothetical protein